MSHDESAAATTEPRRQFNYGFSPEEAVELFKVVAHSEYRSGFGQVYAALGDLVCDENGHVPGHINYGGPAWT